LTVILQAGTTVTVQVPGKSQVPPLTVYTVVEEGFATTVGPLVVFKPVLGFQL
jgi:hypothetical protein